MNRTERDLGMRNNKDISIFLVYDIKINYIIRIFMYLVYSAPKIIHFYDFVTWMPIIYCLLIDFL